jgi:hypothetical protein
VLFKPLTLPEVEQIVDLMTDGLRQRLAEKSMKLELTEDARRLIADRGFDPVYGARPLKRFIARDVETRIGRALISGDARDGAEILVEAEDGDITVRYQNAALGDVSSQSLPIITSVDLMTTVTSSPSARFRLSREESVMTAVTRPASMLTVISAMTEPDLTDWIVPVSWLCALSLICSAPLSPKPIGSLPLPRSRVARVRHAHRQVTLRRPFAPPFSFLCSRPYQAMISRMGGELDGSGAVSHAAAGEVPHTAAPAVVPGAHWLPTRKWWVASISGSFGWLGTWGADAAWPLVSSQLLGMGITIVVQRVLAYAVPNVGWPARLPLIRGNGWGIWWPTAKWWTATLSALIGFPVIWWVTGAQWTRDLTGQAIAIVGQRILAYFVPND